MDNKALILDIGSFSTKVGIAGDDKPTEQRTIAVQTNESVEEKAKETVYYGQSGVDAINNKTKVTVCDIKYEDFISNIIEKDKLSDRPVLLADNIMCNTLDRSSLAELLFEKFEISSLYFEVCGVLGLYSTGRLNGLVCDIGYSQSSFIPIIEGYEIEYASSKIEFGGQYFDTYLNHLLRKAGITLATNYQLEVVRNIKESAGECHLFAGGYEKLQDDEEMNCDKYEMPDGSILQIGTARHRASEVLFAPHLLGAQCNGIQHQILDCINRCDLQLRKRLMAHVTLIGGTSLLKGFPKRLVNELVSNDHNQHFFENVTLNPNKSAHSKPNTLPSTPATKKSKKSAIRLYAPRNRQYSAWIGGSLLSSMEDFKSLWVSQKQYQECGKSVLFRF